MSGHTPWALSSELGWNCIRDGRGNVVLKPATTMNEPEIWQAVQAVNCHTDLLAALKGLLAIEDARIATGAFTPNEAGTAAIAQARAAIEKAEDHADRWEPL